MFDLFGAIGKLLGFQNDDEKKRRLQQAQQQARPQPQATNPSFNQKFNPTTFNPGLPKIPQVKPKKPLLNRAGIDVSLPPAVSTPLKSEPVFDEQRRAQQQQIAQTLQPQQSKGVPFQQAARDVLGGTAKLANSGLGVIEKTGVNIFGGTQKLLGDKAGGERTINEGIRSIDQRLLNKGKGFLGAGGVFNSEQDMRNASPTDTLRRVGGTTLQAAGEVLPVGRGIQVAKRSAPVVQKLLQGALQGAAAGAAGTGGAQIAEQGQIDPSKLLTSTATGAVLGAGIPLAGSVINKVAGKTNTTIRPIEEATNTAPIANTHLKVRQPISNIVPATSPVEVNPNSRFAVRTSKSSQLSPELKSNIQQNGPRTYERVTNEQQVLNSERLLNKGVNKAYTDVNERLSAKNIDDQTVSDSIALIKKFDETGGTANLQKATDMIGILSEKLTKAGQTVQAARLLSNRTPQGLYYGAVRDLKKAGVDVTPAMQNQLNDLINTVKQTKPGTPQSDIARFNVAKFVNDNVPTKTSEKIMNFWRAGLLTAPTTTGGNLLGNTGETLVRKGFVNPVATGADTLMGMFTGKRTQTLSGGFAGGVKEGSSKLGQYLKTGYDERNALSKYDTRETNFGEGKVNEALSRYTNGVYRLMSVADQPFWYGARNEALNSIAKSEAINAKVPSSQRDAYIREFIASPPPKALERATQEAMYATFQNKTGLGTAALGFKNGMNKVAPGLGDFIVPFTQVPASIATRIFQRTPVGTATELVKQIKKVRDGGQFDQRAMSQAIGEGAFGTAVLASGYSLANSGLLTFGFPEDQKERELWEAEGKQPYSLRIGDRWYSLNYLQPFGTLLAIGGQAASDVKNGSNLVEATSNAVATAGQSVMNQSFLKGVSGVLDAIDDPKRYASNWVENTAGSIVPNAVRSLARSADPLQRDANGPIEGLQSTIPGLRQSLPAKQDMFGNDLQAKDNFANQYLNPLRPSIAKDSDPTVAELRRLYEGDEGVLPTQARKDAFKDVSLTDTQVKEINSIAGPQIKLAYDQLTSAPEYAVLSDEDKRKALKKVNETVFGALKAQYGVEKGIIAADSVKLDTNQKRYLQGTGVDFVSKTGTDKTYKEKYDSALEDFKKNSSTFSPVERARREKDLAQLAIKKDFDNDTVALYGMNKGDVYNLISKDAKGKTYADSLLKYGDALVAAGLASTNKFRDKYGNEAIAPKPKTASTKKSSGRKGGKKGVKKVPAKSSFNRVASTAAIRKLLQSSGKKLG